MLISLEYRFMFVANLKTASTAIEAALRPHAEIAIVESRFGKHMPLADAKERFAWVFDFVRREDLFIFGVMRDPVDYTVSLYNSHTCERFKNHPDLYTGTITFDQFLREWAHRNPDQFIAQHTRFLDANGEIGADYIMSYDNLAAGFKQVATKIGIPTSLPLVAQNVSRPRLLPCSLSDDQRRYIAAHFASDTIFMENHCDRFLVRPDNPLSAGR